MKQPGKRKLSDETVERARQEIFGTGYRNPPKHTQFQKGQSGNPKGRPRGVAPDLSMADQPTLGAVLLASRKPVRMREGDKVTEVPAADAIVQAINATALKGRAFAGARNRSHPYRAREIVLKNAFWSAHKEQMSQLLADAESRGEPAPDILPYPGDIEIDPRNGPRFCGPVGEFDRPLFDGTMMICEVLLMQEARDGRSNATAGDQTGSGSAFLLFDFLQRTLPPRLRASEAETAVKLRWHQAWPKRLLLKELTRGWKSTGMPVRHESLSRRLFLHRGPEITENRNVRLVGKYAK